MFALAGSIVGPCDDFLFMQIRSFGRHSRGSAALDNILWRKLLYNLMFYNIFCVPVFQVPNILTMFGNNVFDRGGVRFGLKKEITKKVIDIFSEWKWKCNSYFDKIAFDALYCMWLILCLFKKIIRGKNDFVERFKIFAENNFVGPLK